MLDVPWAVYTEHRTIPNIEKGWKRTLAALHKIFLNGPQRKTPAGAAVVKLILEFIDGIVIWICAFRGRKEEIEYQEIACHGDNR